MRASMLAGCALLLLAAGPALSTTYHVAPDGSGDFPNIQTAINAAASGDEIVLSDGVFTGPGNWDLNFGTKDLVLRSLNGYEATALDGALYCRTLEPTHRGVILEGGQTEATRIEGLTMEKFRPEGDGGAIRSLGSSPVIRSVRFRKNTPNAYDPVRGLYIFVQGGAPIIQDCVFEDDCASEGDSEGLAIYSRQSSPRIERCSFGLTASYSGAAVNLDGGVLVDCDFDGIRGQGERNAVCLLIPEGQVTIQGCSFWYTVGSSVFIDSPAEALIQDCDFESNAIGFGVLTTGNTTIRNTTFRNSGTKGGGCAIVFDGSADRFVTLDHCVILNSIKGYPGGPAVIVGGHVQITHCTFAGNGTASWGYPGPALAVWGDVSIDHTIIAFNGLSNGAVECSGQPLSLQVTCSDFFGNEGGDWTGCVAGMDGTNGNISADPFFCDFLHGNVTLQAQSPCAPPNSGECDLIGALDVGCGTTALQERSWGSIKALYR